MRDYFKFKLIIFFFFFFAFFTLGLSWPILGQLFETIRLLFYWEMKKSDICVTIANDGTLRFINAAVSCGGEYHFEGLPCLH